MGLNGGKLSLAVLLMCVGDGMQMKWLLFCVFLHMCLQLKGTCQDGAAFWILDVSERVKLLKNPAKFQTEETPHVLLGVYVCLCTVKDADGAQRMRGNCANYASPLFLLSIVWLIPSCIAI